MEVLLPRAQLQNLAELPKAGKQEDLCHKLQ